MPLVRPAMGGDTRTFAEHGFSYTLPEGFSYEFETNGLPQKTLDYYDLIVKDSTNGRIFSIKLIPSPPEGIPTLNKYKTLENSVLKRKEFQVISSAETVFQGLPAYRFQSILNERIYNDTLYVHANGHIFILQLSRPNIDASTDMGDEVFAGFEFTSKARPDADESYLEAFKHGEEFGKAIVSTMGMIGFAVVCGSIAYWYSNRRSTSPVAASVTDGGGHPESASSTGTQVPANTEPNADT
ncbi:MAG: hypothetical protein QM811_27315 [Pirellulales bacterium]